VGLTDVINSCPTTTEVYDTDRRTELTAPETISRSRHLVGAHQNLNGSRDLTTPLSGLFCHPWASHPCVLCRCTTCVESVADRTETHAVDNNIQASSKDISVQLSTLLPLTIECTIGLIVGLRGALQMQLLLLLLAQLS